MKKFAYCVLSLFLVAVVACAGCGKDSQYKKVTGKVTMDGAPLEGATVMFYSTQADGDSGAGKTAADGSFDVTSSRATQGGSGLMPGQYNVTVIKYEVASDPDQEAFDKGEITYDELQQRKNKKGPNAKTAQSKLLTPNAYASSTNTPLKVTVTENAADNVFEFNLEK